MSTHIIGFRPPDERWLKMKAIYDSCIEANVAVPNEVAAFFGHDTPDENGVEADIYDAIKSWQDDSRDGYELDVTKLPPDIKIIRFYNSW